MGYGVALLEKEACDGLDMAELKTLYACVANNEEDEVYPIELEAKHVESSAMGFISKEAANLLDYDYEASGLHDFIASILDDMNNENESQQYSFNGINIYLSC